MTPRAARLPSRRTRTRRCTRPLTCIAGSLAGADASALLYSLGETAKAKALGLWAYLNHLFEHRPNATSAEDADVLRHIGRHQALSGNRVVARTLTAQ